MEKEKIIKKMISGEYTVNLIVECWCDFSWELDNNRLRCFDAHDDSYFVNRLVVEGENLAEYDYTRKDISVYGIEQKDIPDQVMLNLVSDISKNQYVPWILEHDDFRKAGSLAEFVKENGYEAVLSGNYFLLVDNGKDVDSAESSLENSYPGWIENHEWADKYISPEGPMNNNRSYFIFIDNTHFVPEMAHA